ncbi:MAG TPA: cytidylate kinase family protein, partial [Candidatus Paceibacterota bacterium]|nr:cytidylate kinase family protein [Candidatus Paceibacterota bacterium]
IFGMAGTGTSSTGKILAKELDYPFISGGDVARMTAQELGITLNEIDELAKTDKKIDVLRDDLLREFGNTHPNCVIEARLGWFVIPDSFKVKLFCSDEVRYGRIMKREGKSLEQVIEETKHREDAIRERFFNHYGIDFDKETGDDRFDLVIDTGLHSLDEVVALIKERAFS